MQPLRNVGVALVFFLLYFLAGAGIVHAQDNVVVLLDTNLPDATVYADSVRLGRASAGLFVVPAATRELRVVPSAGELWSIAPLTAALQAGLGDTLEVSLRFPYHYRIESVPFGASVSVETLEGRTPIGATPLLYRTPSVPEGTFLVERPGYMAERITPGSEVWNRYVLTMRPVTPEQTRAAEMAWNPPARRRRWIDYTAAAVAVGAGALAVHYKFKADRLDDRYRENGDPLLRDRTEALDTRALVALGVMQASVGVLAIRFVLR